MRSGSAGGCDFPVDPLLDLPEVPVFWSPAEDTSVVVLTTAPEILDSPHEFSPNIVCSAERADGFSACALHDLGKGQRAQIALPNGIPSGEPLVAVIPLGIDGFDRLEAVHRLLAALHDRSVPPDTRLTRQQRARLRRMLRAFDGSRDGATQQEIAQIIFNLHRLSRDEWQASSARHAVMSLLRGAQAMIAGGYRKLLRHRRQP